MRWFSMLVDSKILHLFKHPCQRIFPLPLVKHSWVNLFDLFFFSPWTWYNSWTCRSPYGNSKTFHCPTTCFKGGLGLFKFHGTLQMNASLFSIVVPKCVIFFKLLKVFHLFPSFFHRSSKHWIPFLAHRGNLDPCSMHPWDPILITNPWISKQRLANHLLSTF